MINWNEGVSSVVASSSIGGDTNGGVGRAHNDETTNVETPIAEVKNGRLYPNPASNSVTFNYSAKVENKITLKVYDGLGQRVGEKEGVSNRIEFSTADLQPGVYHVKVFDGSSYLETHLLTILR